MNPSSQYVAPASQPGRRADQWLPLLRDALAQRGSLRWLLRGTSMSPTLPAGCEIEIVPLPETVHLGGVVVFALSDVLIAHRVVGRRRDGGMITQGDGYAWTDAPWERAQALGRVRSAYVNGHRIWPGPYERGLVLFWLARYRVLAVRRNLVRVGRRIRRTVHPA